MRIQTLVMILIAVAPLAACKKKAGSTSGDVSSSEQAYVEKGVASLEAALAKGDEAGVLVECMSAKTSVDHMPTTLADKIRKLCYVEAPRLMLTNAIADAKKNQAEHPELRDMSCMQLLASDAFEWMAKQQPPDAGVQKLADEYAQLCPAEAKKARDRAEAKKGK